MNPVPTEAPPQPQAQDPAAEHGDLPLQSYAMTTAVFATAVTVGIVAASRSGRELQDRVSAGDLILAGVATHKLSRLITKAKVTAFLRAPFTRLQDKAGQGELSEEPRGEGMRRVVGELLVCPYCVSQWVAAGMVGGLVVKPGLTRAVAGVYTAETIADFLHLAYVSAKDRV